MKSRAAFEFTVRKMLRQNPRLYFWTFTFREVHSLKRAMELWNEFLTQLKRKLKFRGVRVLELHEEHGCHFHVLTNRRFAIRRILSLGERYGFGRTDVRLVEDVPGEIAYLCKYLSKRRPRCLKRARLWSAFGKIERTRVKDVVLDTPMSRIVRRVMGKRTIDDELAGNVGPPKVTGYRPETNFVRAMQKARLIYLHGFDSEHFERQAIWEKARGSGLIEISPAWSDRPTDLE